MRTDSRKLIRDVDVLIRDAEDLIRATAGEMAEKTREARARLAGAMMVAKETCRRLEGKARGRVEMADKIIREHPYVVLGLALGAGLMIAVVAHWREAGRRGPWGF